MHLTADIIFCFRSDGSDEFQNVNTFILDWKLVYRCKIKTNEVTKVQALSKYYFVSVHGGKF